ncbi:NYN domain-containing protein [Candidatus Parcubacteria bacterium]|nr:MAG: NYN domain-containing protein [Candidatus Parcubacteria bacterium]
MKGAKATITHSHQRVGVFVDVQNLYHSAKNLHQARVNYRELLRHLVGERQLIRAVAYVVKSEGIEGARTGEPRSPRAAPAEGGSSEAAFFEALVNTGLELRMKDLQVYPGGMKKADWDVGMAVDAIRMASFLDVVILVTGDGDFLPLVDYLKWGVGRMVEVAAFRRSASAKMQEAADRFIDLEEVPRIILRR